MPRVSIIILNWNGLKDTIECLESFKKINYPNYEVIVVDNGSEGNDADILKENYKGYIRLIRNEENLWFAGGNNVVIREVIKEGKSKYILYLNDDITVEPDFFKISWVRRKEFEYRRYSTKNDFRKVFSVYHTIENFLKINIKYGRA